MSKIEKIEIKPNQYVWVDKDAEIKEGDRYHLQSVTSKNVILKASENKSSINCFKIIAASPELNLEGGPSHLEWLAEKEVENQGWGKYEFTSEQFGIKNSFINGYQIAEKELPTWDDVRKAIELAQKEEWDEGGYLGLKYEPQEIIEQLKQEKDGSKKTKICYNKLE